MYIICVAKPSRTTPTMVFKGLVVKQKQGLGNQKNWVCVSKTMIYSWGIGFVGFCQCPLLPGFLVAPPLPLPLTPFSLSPSVSSRYACKCVHAPDFLRAKLRASFSVF